jgi:hypothetical protein
MEFFSVRPSCLRASVVKDTAWINSPACIHRAPETRPTAALAAHQLGRVYEINQPSVSGKGRSAKATEAEAGQRPVPPRATPAQRPFLLHSESASDGLGYFVNTA